MRCKRVPWLSVLGVGSLTLLSADALAADPCTGHKLLRTPRPESSCNNVKPAIYPSPDGTARALVYPVDISLNATPDLESRVVIRSNKGETLTSKDYASPRGFNGYYVVSAKWSPDSKFFVYSMSSSGGHSPWQISDRGVQSRQKSLRAVQRHDQRQSDAVRRFQIHRTAYGGRYHMEASRGVG